MRLRHSLVFLTSVLIVGACGGGDSSGPGPVATSIEIVVAPPASATAGVALPTSPTFIVRDQNGNVLPGVAVAVAVTAGGGTLANAPTVSASGPTSVGRWTLGGAIATNSLTITVAGIPSVTVTVASAPGGAAKVIAQTPTAISGTVGQGVSPLPAVRVTDAFDNPVGSVAVSVALTGGGSTSATTVITDAGGNAAVPDWTLGTVKGPHTLTMSAGSASTVFTSLAAAGPLQTLATVLGDNQIALAGTAVPAPIRLAPTDQYGNTLDGQTAIFSIGAGGGVVVSTPVQAGPNGSINAPAWTLGKSAVPQQLIATVAGRTATINASVQSDYIIDVRFWGSPMTSEQQALFTTAAARIRAIVVGSLPVDDATGADPAACGVTGVPVLNEIIPGVVIYASIQAIDGKGRILARAGPCYYRTASDLRTVIGVMEFDVDDIGSLAGAGSLTDVITHEMLHVVGVGSVWDNKGLLRNYNTSTVEYVGVSGLQGCRETGGTTSCASAVPVENTGGPGTANSHWRESVFASELMTGYISSGTMPLSVMTVRSIEDLGYSVNPYGADSYVIALGSLRQGGESGLISPVGVEWERGLSRGPFVLPRERSSVRER